ncbi:TorF family putative porin [Pseudomonas sp. Gutcm_11s]|uniref:TorF family putative porin n=1 Tax=Pseudomonas sp. Gutcm_11s TaxID=3026088 RepID=UPI0023627C4B|nr:TorF family putative porin [Pseudomonas sp. Gutcm_11s]MDD0844220.1 TorF family putative porin [Pseudomonas sp. Gutcm_11s]
MKRSTALLLAGLALTPLSSQAVPINDDFFVDIDLTLASDYRTRGISQTQGDPALQAGATLGHSSGLYAGVWTSNVDFGYGLKTRQEVDYYAGWYWQATEAVSLDLGYIKYAYPKESQFNQSEAYAILNAYGFKAAAYYSRDLGNFIGEDQDTLYTWVGYETQLPLEIGLDLRYGRMDLKDPLFWSNSGQSRDSYREWEVKLTRDFFDVTWGLSYVDTDLSEAECFSNYGFTDACTATVVASVSKTF